MSYLTRDRDNLESFERVVNTVYAQAKKQGKISPEDIRVYDRLALKSVSGGRHQGWVPPTKKHREWREKVARMYWKDHGRSVGAFFPWDIDWDKVTGWLLDNIVGIIRIIIVLLPFVIG